LAFRLKASNPFKVFPLRSEAALTSRSGLLCVGAGAIHNPLNNSLVSSYDGLRELVDLKPRVE